MFIYSVINFPLLHIILAVSSNHYIFKALFSFTLMSGVLKLILDCIIGSRSSVARDTELCIGRRKAVFSFHYWQVKQVDAGEGRWMLRVLVLLEVLLPAC